MTTERWLRRPALRITSSQQKGRFVSISLFCIHPKQALKMPEMRVNPEAKMCGTGFLRGCLSENMKTLVAESMISQHESVPVDQKIVLCVCIFLDSVLNGFFSSAVWTGAWEEATITSGATQGTHLGVGTGGNAHQGGDEFVMIRKITDNAVVPKLRLRLNHIFADVIGAFGTIS